MTVCKKKKKSNSSTSSKFYPFQTLGMFQNNEIFRCYYDNTRAKFYWFANKQLTQMNLQGHTAKS